MLADASSDRVLVIKDVYFASTSTCTCACKLYSKPLADNAGRKKRQNLGLFWVFSLHVLYTCLDTGEEQKSSNSPKSTTCIVLPIAMISSIIIQLKFDSIVRQAPSSASKCFCPPPCPCTRTVSPGQINPIP